MRRELDGARHALAGEAGAQQRHRMAFEGEAEEAVVAHHLLAEAQLRQSHRGLRRLARLGQQAREERQPLLPQPLHRPERPAPVEIEGAERIRLGQTLQHRLAEA